MENSIFYYTLQDIESLSSVFNNVSVSHVRRQGTCVAHRLASRAINNYFLVWMESIPPDIYDV